MVVSPICHPDAPRGTIALLRYQSLLARHIRSQFEKGKGIAGLQDQRFLLKLSLANKRLMIAPSIDSPSSPDVNLSIVKKNRASVAKSTN